MKDKLNSNQILILQKIIKNGNCNFFFCSNCPLFSMLEEIDTKSCKGNYNLENIVIEAKNKLINLLFSSMIGKYYEL